jgi:outer membrane protein assembly factor BamB
VSMASRFTLAMVITGLLSVNTGMAGDWLRFRGPNGTGISSDDDATPISWSPTENLKWKIELPGAGVSSPIVVGDQIFVTCYSGYGGGRDAGNMEDLKRHLVCIDRTAGSIVWQKTVDAVMPEDRWGGAGIPSHGYASHTPVSDGERVYVFFGKTGVLAFDLDGNQLWQTSVGTGSDQHEWGSSSSPILVDDLVVVSAGPESRALIGLNAKTGEQLWKADGDGLGNTWGTPTIATLEGGKSEIVIGTPYEIWGLNPKNGKLRWYCEAGESEQFSSSVVVVDGIVYSSEGRGGGTIALKAGGRGDVTDSNVLWSGESSTRFGSPVVTGGRMYSFTSSVVNCFDAATGERVFQGRLQGGNAVPQSGRGPGGQAGRPGGEQQRGGERRQQGGPPGEGRPQFGGGSGGGRPQFGGGGRGFGNMDYSSPVVADAKIYFVSGSGVTHVVKAGGEFEQLAANRVTTDQERFGASPAISNGEIFLRSDKHLYCIAETAE